MTSVVLWLCTIDRASQKPIRDAPDSTIRVNYALKGIKNNKCQCPEKLTNIAFMASTPQFRIALPDDVQERLHASGKYYGLTGNTLLAAAACELSRVPRERVFYAIARIAEVADEMSKLPAMPPRAPIETNKPRRGRPPKSSLQISAEQIAETAAAPTPPSRIY
jgi:hypothetical protein